MQRPCFLVSVEFNFSRVFSYCLFSGFVLILWWTVILFCGSYFVFLTLMITRRQESLSPLFSFSVDHPDVHTIFKQRSQVFSSISNVKLLSLSKGITPLSPHFSRHCVSSLTEGSGRETPCRQASSSLFDSTVFCSPPLFHSWDLGLTSFVSYLFFNLSKILNLFLI